ncbi:MAG: cyclic nucleotide-binding domain-containing protein [Candidatus Zixiibacteriota bacterium]|nr:MAG: cyclic nucleotide-binding domain-containing protein [candidate division Zixibacteria bacterium]
MLTVIEKVIFLQNIDIFSEVPTESLAALAAIAEEVSFLKGDQIFKEHDRADALYLVLDGKVKLHRGKEEIAEATGMKAFGTWALFDEEPRVVTATCAEDSRLLRIDREDFIDLLADHVQVAQGILKTVVKRLRSLVEKVA